MKKGIIYSISAATLMLCLSMPAIAGEQPASYKLSGAWVAKVVGMPGQWSYVVSADPSGRSAAGHGSIDAGFNVDSIFGPVFEPTDSDSPILISAVMSGPDTASFYAIWYGLKELASSSPISHEIVLIGVVKGELEFVAPGKAYGTHNFEFYFPSQDADGDGFPDEGEYTPYTFQMNTVDTRLPAP